MMDKLRKMGRPFDHKGLISKPKAGTVTMALLRNKFATVLPNAKIKAVNDIA